MAKIINILHKYTNYIWGRIYSKSNRERIELHPWVSLIAKELAYWEDAKKASVNGPRVLVATSLGGYNQGVTLESTIAVALTLRGAQVDVLLCDKFLPACQMDKFSMVLPKNLIQNESRRCENCFRSGSELLNPLGLPILHYSQFISEKENQQAVNRSDSIPLEQISDYELDGIAAGEHAYAGTLRYFGRGDLEGEPKGEKVLRQYLKASILTVFVMRKLLKRKTYDLAYFHHGIYVPQGIIGEVCRHQGVRVVNWNPAYRQHSFIFSHGDSYHHTMISESTTEWENISWNTTLEEKTMAYLKSRWQGTEDWIWFHEKPQEDIDVIAHEIGVDFYRPCIGMLTNVMWDAQLHYESNAFPNMLEWVLQTISYFKKRPDMQLIIRVHPAEIRGMIPSRQPILPEIQSIFPILPSNVFIIPPESQVSTYAVMEKCNSVIIYNTKTGIELSSMGIPVVVAGEAWIRNKGFSFDVHSVKEYFEILDQLPFPNGLNDGELEKARKYAFHFFFRRMIPLTFITSPERAKFTTTLTSLEELEQGNFPGLDVICDGILEKTPFIYPVEFCSNSEE